MSEPTPRKRGNPNWVAGVSGNPDGKSPEAAQQLYDVIKAARLVAPKALQVLADIAGDPDCATAPRVTACGMILDRAFGKAFQAITGPDGEKLQVEHHVFVTNLMRQLTAGAVTIDGEALAVEPPKEGE